MKEITIACEERRKFGGRFPQSLGSLRQDDDDGHEDGKKAIGLDKQNNSCARASRFFVHFSAAVARLQRETA